MRHRAWIVVSLLLALSGCGRGKKDGCGSARGTLPAGLTELKWDRDTPTFSVRGKHYTVTANGQTFKLDDQPLWEAVRFDLDRPAKVHGFTVTYANLDSVANDRKRPIEAGLYPDFGGNGFDFWQKQPLWSGTRCAGDLVEGTTTYVFDEPVVVDEPGLVYVAHAAFEPTDPTFSADSHGHSGNCATFADCHSSIDMPQALANQYYNGISFSFPYDFVVRLYVEYTADVPTQPVFQKVAGPVIGLRMAWGDYDHDGFDDLLTQDQTSLFTSRPVLWRNLGDGTFADATATSGLASMPIFGSGVWGDYDNDGCLDAFFTSESEGLPNTLVHSNCDGTFSDVTTAAGPVTGELTPAADPCPNAVTDGYFEQSQAAAWVDLDGDGFLDLYVANYNCGGPTSPEFIDNIYRNRGDGTFEDWTATRGFETHGSASRGANPIDLDGDGDMDVLVHDYLLERNLFYRNRGDGTVQEIARGNGLDGDVDLFGNAPYWGHTLGTAWGDLDGDGDWDLVEANLAHPRFYGFSDKTRVLRNEAGKFVDLSGDWSFPKSAAGLRYQETHTVPLLADFDQDGVLDLAISARSDRATGDRRPMEFYWGRGDGTFRDAMFESGLDAPNGWGLASADFDHDGDPDIATTSGIFRNTMSVGTNHWLQVHAVGNVSSNRSAIGATVVVRAGTKRWMRYVEGSTGQGCQDSANLHFGLGNVTTVDSIEVRFPAGATRSFSGPFAVGQRIWVYEDGSALPGWIQPG